jgi:hypothetical protein
VVVDDGHDLALGQVRQALGQVGVVHEDDLLVGGVGENPGGGDAELLEHELAFGLMGPWVTGMTSMPLFFL